MAIVSSTLESEVTQADGRRDVWYSFTDQHSVVHRRNLKILASDNADTIRVSMEGTVNNDLLEDEIVRHIKNYVDGIQSLNDIRHGTIETILPEVYFALDYGPIAWALNLDLLISDPVVTDVIIENAFGVNTGTRNGIKNYASSMDGIKSSFYATQLGRPITNG